MLLKYFVDKAQTNITLNIVFGMPKLGSLDNSANRLLFESSSKTKSALQWLQYTSAFKSVDLKLKLRFLHSFKLPSLTEYGIKLFITCLNWKINNLAVIVSHPHQLKECKQGSTHIDNLRK